ncbi:MAG: DUF438 domain-containing protein [Candidatus Thorarchaeota archaeon]
MAHIDQLANILKRLNEGEDPSSVKEETREFLASVSPEELSYAEQKLIEAGLPPEDLRHLCSAHMDMLGDDLEKMRMELEPGHVVHTMVCEHDKILSFLDQLEGLNMKVQSSDSLKKSSEEYKKLVHIAEHLLDAESHHLREEEVLFQEIESRGVTGPPRIMRMEHDDMRHRKHELKTLTEVVDEMDFTSFKSRLDTVSKMIILTLRDHIFKENNILYPTALSVIQDDEIWRKMKIRCDEIGYCCFTPSH